MVSEEAQQIDEVLRAKSQQASEDFSYLNELAEKREKANFEPAQKPTKTSSWAEKLEKMREKYPNAYRPWKFSDDAELKRLFETGSNLKEMSEALGRHEGSIKMRLQKHYGEDIIV